MEILGRYTLLRRVAAGGMAEIWKAKAVGPAGFQKTVAIKRILPHLVEETEFIQMFIEEAKLAAELVHPNVIQVFDFGQLGPNDYFIAMEYVAGPSLARLLKRIRDRGGAFPAAAALYVVTEAAKGLAHAHTRTDEAGRPLNIVHRDVSPQNILISYAGEVKIGDFGIAKAAGAVTRTQEGQVRGKLSYMSPEQANASKALDGRADLFSLGIVLFELLTGRKLFPANVGTVEAYGRVAGFRGLDQEDLAAVPAPFREVVGKALRAEPAERFQTGLELDAALTGLLGAQGGARAKDQLATMVQTLFDEERKYELTPTAAPAPAAATDAPLVLGSLGGPVEAETVKSPAALVPPAEPLPRQPAPTPQSPSGLTLASTKIGVQDLGPAGPAPAAVAAPTPRLSPGLIGAGAGGLALLVVAAGFAVRLAGLGPVPPATATAEATVTAAAIATATSAVGATTAAAPTPTPVPSATPTRAAVAATPVGPGATPTPRAVAGRPGTLNVTSRPWVQVWVDNALVKSETPLTGHRIAAGPHRVRFVNPGLGFDETRTIHVPSDGEVNVQIDVRARSITLR